MSKLKEVKDGSSDTMSHWSWKSGKPIISVDFHHTITTTCEACEHFDGKYHLQKGVKEALAELSKHFRIIIFTGNPDGNEWIKNVDAYKKKMRNFLDSNGMLYPIHFVKVPSIFIIDDRAIHHRSWLETLEEIHRRVAINVE